MSFRFEDLKVWQEARVFAKEIYIVTSKFPNNEKFSLTDQIRRAVVSIALNIAEGSIRKSDKEFVRFLRISMGSIAEVITALYIAMDLEYLNKKRFNFFYEKANMLTLKINALINSFKKQ